MRRATSPRRAPSHRDRRGRERAAAPPPPPPERSAESLDDELAWRELEARGSGAIGPDFDL